MFSVVAGDNCVVSPGCVLVTWGVLVMADKLKCVVSPPEHGCHSSDLLYVPTHLVVDKICNRERERERERERYIVCTI